MSSSLYLEHLSDSDVGFLATVAGESIDGFLSRARTDSLYLETLFQDSSVYRALFQSGEDEALLRASPFFVFAVMMHRASRDLAGASFVEEWIGPGKRMPMFAVGALRDFASDPLKRVFLSELLASYTHVASGSVWVRTARGWRRRRFSELDPFRVIDLLDVLPESERPRLYRRLGDLALFLTGVFPDYTAARLFPSIPRQRLERAVRRMADPPPYDLRAAHDEIWLLEQLGRGAYALASNAAQAESGVRPPLLTEVADGFGEARRILNFLTDRYLFPFRECWFPLAG